jgi:hypothetical protein
LKPSAGQQDGKYLPLVAGQKRKKKRKRSRQEKKRRIENFKYFIFNKIVH